MSSALTWEELLELARRFEGRTLETVTGKEFTVGIYRDCPFFTRLRAATDRATVARRASGSWSDTTKLAASDPATMRTLPATPPTTSLSFNERDDGRMPKRSSAISGMRRAS